jgi:hypothetical protein
MEEDPPDGSQLKKRYVEALGRTAIHGHTTNEQYELALRQCTVPCGSEGSLDWDLYDNRDLGCAAAYLVRIWGDLRDYGTTQDLDAIGEWFTRCCCGEKFMVHQAILHADNGVDDRVWMWNGKELVVLAPNAAAENGRGTDNDGN